MDYLVTAKQVVVYVPTQVGGCQLRQQVTVKQGHLLPDGVTLEVLESLLNNGLIDVDFESDEYTRLFRHDTPVAARGDDGYAKLFQQPYEPKPEADPEGYSDFAKLLPLATSWPTGG